VDKVHKLVAIKDGEASQEPTCRNMVCMRKTKASASHALQNRAGQPPAAKVNGKATEKAPWTHLRFSSWKDFMKLCRASTPSRGMPLYNDARQPPTDLWPARVKSFTFCAS